MWRISFLIKIILLISAKIFKIWQKSFSSLWDNVYYFLSKGGKSSAFLLTACQTSGIKGMAYIYSLSHHSNTVTAMHAFFGDTNPFRFPCRQIEMINNRAVETQNVCQPRNLECFSIDHRNTVAVHFWINPHSDKLKRVYKPTHPGLSGILSGVPLPANGERHCCGSPSTQNFPPPSTSSLATQLFLFCLYQLTLLAFWFGNSPNPVFQLPPWSHIL